MELKTTAKLREETTEALKEELNKSQKELFTVKMNLELNSSKQSHKSKELRRYVARIKTLLNERVS